MYIRAGMHVQFRPPICLCPRHNAHVRSDCAAFRECLSNFKQRDLRHGKTVKLMTSAERYHKRDLTIYDILYMRVPLSVFDVYGNRIRRQKIDTKSSQTLFDQIEEISPFLKWQKLRLLPWRKGTILDPSTIWSANGENRIRDNPHLPKQLEHIKRNYEALLKEHNIDFYTLELQEKSQRELEMEYKHTDVQCQINPYLVKL